MNTRERFLAVMNFEKVPPLKAEYGFWTTTIKNFISDGMPVTEELPENILDSGTISGADKVDPDDSTVTDKNVRAYFHLDTYISKFPCNFSLTEIASYCPAVAAPATGGSAGCAASPVDASCGNTCVDGYTANTGITCEVNNATVGAWSAAPTCTGVSACLV